MPRLQDERAKGNPVDDRSLDQLRPPHPPAERQTSQSLDQTWNSLALSDGRLKVLNTLHKKVCKKEGNNDYNKHYVEEVYILLCTRQLELKDNLATYLHNAQTCLFEFKLKVVLYQANPFQYP